MKRNIFYSALLTLGLVVCGSNMGYAQKTEQNDKKSTTTSTSSSSTTTSSRMGDTAKMKKDHKHMSDSAKMNKRNGSSTNHERTKTNKK